MISLRTFGPTAFAIAALAYAPVAAIAEGDSYYEMSPDPEHFESRTQTSLDIPRQVESRIKPSQPGTATGSVAKGTADFVGKALVDDSGDELGTIEGIVRHRATGRLNALVSVGGFAGVGTELAAVPLEDLERRSEGYAAPDFANSEKTLISRLEYDASDYVPVSVSN
ncbi:PRC-barrel domain-containing protein [Imhoffiella purpurea]|uniref:PRC-barrel domain-containing protein n=1 Tax=Imhoffiella purpurea TaxID=1249627 RepID=W9VCS2_9GAMM|nr:PRC-barrel domain-containing protein [Imhoffiella purpurea]EXJ14796.1 hypothetical protein D779_2165 [Imhoffiella purpurea]